MTDDRTPPVRLSDVDRMYLALETPRSPMHFGALVMLDGRGLHDGHGSVRFPEIRRQLACRVGTIPELRRVVRDGSPFGRPEWTEDPDFRIARHVVEVGMPPGPRDLASVLALAEVLMAPPFDRDHPLWRLWLVTGMPDGRVALLFAIHHALADGLEAMRLARSLLSDPVRDRPVIARAGPASRSTPSAAGGLVDALRAFHAGWSATRGEPRTSLNAAVGERRRTVVMRLDLATARRVARANGGGVNDLVLALATGGVRALLGSRGEPIDGFEPRAGISVALPPSARRDGGANQFGSYVVGLPIGIHDPAARIGAIAAGRDRAKATQAVTGMSAIRAVTARFAPLRRLMARQRYVNVMETYLPGPPAGFKLLGAPVLDVIPLQPLGRNIGLTFVASSYAGTLTVAIRVDPEAFPDIDRLQAAMDRDWRALTELPALPLAA